jgi:hypothetical protein
LEYLVGCDQKDIDRHVLLDASKNPNKKHLNNRHKEQKQK